MDKVVLVFVACTLATPALGLVCMTCENARSHEECDRNGVLRKCQENEQMCFIEERKLNYGPQKIIFKRCKQPHACKNNYIQNDRPAWWPTQCNSNHPNTVCRCCCDTDSCNVGYENCFKKEVTSCKPAHVAPTNGAVVCNNENKIGSVCGFECDDGFEMRGVPSSVCEQSGKWSSPAPTCSQIRCNPPHDSIVNGAVTCTRGNAQGSECSFTCDYGYELVGAPQSTCQRGGRWSSRAPTCRRISCLDQGDLLNGRISCSDENYVDSTCSFVCNGNPYYVSPEDSSSNTCMENGRWSKPTPCCARPCPPYAIFDLVLILDSSSSVGDEGWEITKEFAKIFARLYDISNNTLRFSVFRYNGQVDTVSQVGLGDGLNKEEVLEAIGNIPYDGSGTKTGQALKYARDVILSPANGNRDYVQDIVIVLTDGRSQDDVREPADMLRQQGVLTYAIGVVPANGALDYDDLNAIGGDDEHVIVAEAGFQALNSDFAIEISDHICGNPCDHVQSYSRNFDFGH